jgi:hypothetical protein
MTELIEKIDKLKMEGGKPKQVHFLSQGAYGCIFHPGVSCDGDKADPNFVTKIQKNERTTANETAVSNKIKQIKGYARFFAPIVKQCPVNFSSDTNTELKKCEVFKEESVDPNHIFVSNKIRYVGKRNMRRHLLDKYVPQYASYGSEPHNPIFKPQVTTKHARAFFAELLRTHIYLNRGIEQLVKHKLVHNDIRYNNVMFDQKLEVPILIDFGLSIDIRELSPATYQKRFYVFDIYPYWSMDIHICNYIFQVISYPKSKTEKITEETVSALVNSFIYKQTTADKNTLQVSNEVFNLNIIDTQVKRFIKKWNAYLKRFVNKTWFDLYEATIKHFATWDIYSICVVYMMVLDDLFVKNIELYKILYETHRKELTEYIQVVSSVLYETSDKRTSLEKLNRILRNIQKNM